MILKTKPKKKKKKVVIVEPELRHLFRTALWESVTPREGPGVDLGRAGGTVSLGWFENV